MHAIYLTKYQGDEYNSPGMRKVTEQFFTTFNNFRPVETKAIKKLPPGGLRQSTNGKSVRRVK